MPPPIKTVNPTTGEVLGTYDIMDQAEIAERSSRARRAQKAWRKMPLEERACIIKDIARVIRREEKALAESITMEMGKTIRESLYEVRKTAWVTEFLANASADWLPEEEVLLEGKRAKILYEPLGVVASIMPWNYPIMLPLRVVAPALLCGNASLLKPSSVVCETSLMLEEILTEVGLPEDVHQTIIGDARTGQELLSQPVDLIALTGSIETGRAVYLRAASGLKRVLLELGGSDPFIVLEDADLEEAARAAVQGRFSNAGQSCIAPKRFLIHRSVADDFLREMVDKVEGLVVGSPLDEATDVGPLVREEQRVVLKDQVHDALSKGGEVLCGGHYVKGPGFFFEPTVVTSVKQDMRVFKEEVFGPVAAVSIFSSPEEALDLANSSMYGLGASIWTSDLDLAEHMARDVEAGMVAINTLVKSDPRLPFGGLKGSGLGRELSRLGFQEVVNVKTIMKLA